MKPAPDFVEEDLSPPWFQARCLAFLFLEGEQLLLDMSRAFTALEKMGMNVLTGGIRRQALRGHWKVFSEAGVPFAMAALEAWIPYRSFRPCNESICLREVTTLDLPHQKVNIVRYHARIFREDDVVPITEDPALSLPFSQMGLIITRHFDLGMVGATKGVRTKADSIHRIDHAQSPC